MNHIRKNPKTRLAYSNSPLVSIVTPNYNGSKYISETIQSVLDQDYQNIEHIIVDDGSIDQSRDIIRKFQKQNPARIKVIFQTNHGQSSAVNVGFKKARGELIGWINSDDTFCAGAISAIMEAYLENQKEKAIVFGNLNIIDQNGKFVRHIKQLRLDLGAGSLLGFGKLVASNTVFWKKSLFGKIGYLKEDFTCNMDGEYFAKLLRAAPSVHIEKSIANFRTHPGANSSDLSPAKMRKYYSELDFEVRRSYSQLPISKFWPYQISVPIKMFYKAKRFFIRLHQ